MSHGDLALFAHGLEEALPARLRPQSAQPRTHVTSDVTAAEGPSSLGIRRFLGIGRSRGEKRGHEPVHRIPPADVLDSLVFDLLVPRRLLHVAVASVEVTLDIALLGVLATEIGGIVLNQDAGTLFGFPLDGIRVSATDLDWSAGQGAELRGRSRDLLPLLAGRNIGRCPCWRLLPPSSPAIRARASVADAA